MKTTKTRNSDSLDTIVSKHVKTEKTPKEIFLKKRKNKVITKASMYKLFGLQDSPLLKDYRQAYKCNETVIKDRDTGKVTTYYCKKRCCTLCSRIKSAQSLAKYGEGILKLGDLYLVTLTNTNVFKGELNDEISRMVKVISKIRENMRVQGFRLNGYKNFECTYSYYKGFNPHFHFVVQGKEVAEMLLRLWLKHNPDATKTGQDITKVGKTKKDLLEVFKYVAKPVTKGYYNPIAYDEIMCSLINRRTSEPLGEIRGAKSLKQECTTDIGLEDLESQNINWNGYQFNVWNYVDELHDWVSDEGECLIDEPLDKETKEALEAINKPFNNEEEIPKENHSNDYTRISYRTDRQILF